MKFCTNKNCKQVNPQASEKFYAGKPCWCKECVKTETKKYALKNSEKLKSYWKSYRSSSDVKNRNRARLLKSYGLSIGQYEMMLKNQNYQCAICQRKESELKRALCIDHDHLNNKIRGLLCDDCNLAIGKLKDNPNLFRVAASYLEQS